MNFLHAFDHRDILVRAIKTGLQAALAVIVTGLANVTNLSDTKALAIAALAAAVSAIWNYGLQALQLRLA